MKTKKTGFILILIAVVFSFAETAYFGNNWTPQTPAEKICDCLAILIWVRGVYLLCYGTSEQ